MCLLGCDCKVQNESTFRTLDLDVAHMSVSTKIKIKIKVEVRYKKVKPLNWKEKSIMNGLKSFPPVKGGTIIS